MTQRLLAILYLVSLQNMAISQQSLIDSLKNELKSSTGVDRQNILLDLAWEYSYANVDSSEFYCFESIRLAEQRNNQTDLAISKSMLAIVYDIKGEIEEAAALYLEVAKYYEDQNNLEELSKTYNNLGVLFFYRDQYEKSWEYYLKSMMIDSTLGNEQGVAESMVNLAAISNIHGDYDQALRYLKKGEKISNKYPENTWVKKGIYDGLANNLLYRGKYDSSLIYYKREYQILTNENDIHSTLTCLNGIISAYLGKVKYDSALQYLTIAEQLSANYDEVAIRKKRNELGAILFAALGNYRKAFDYQKRYQIVSDSISQQESLKITNELEEKYQAEQKENEIAQLELAQQQSKNQRNIILLIAALILGVSVLLLILYRVKSRSEAAITKSLNEKETLLKEIHHRVKNNLQVVSSLLSMQSRFIKDEQALGAVNEGQTRVESMALIHQKLYQENNLSGVSAKEYIEDLAEVLKQSYSTNDEVEFEYDVEDLTIDVDTIIPIGLIMNELICNSLKHAFPENHDGIISVRLKENNSQLRLEVSDNGVGADGPSDDQSFGMVLIDSLAMKLKATLQIDTKNGTSTVLTISKYKLV